MARVINTNSPGKRRSAYMRTIAEILRRLSQARELTPETRDAVAWLVYCLRGIDGTVEESMVAWEKRGYWKKSDEFQQKWFWATRMAAAIEDLIKTERWHDLPATMLDLFPHVADIQVSRLTRDPNDWQGAYQKLMREPRL